MAFNKASPHQHLGLHPFVKPAEQPSTDRSGEKYSHIAPSGFATQSTESETPHQRPANLSYIPPQRDIYQAEVTGTPFKLPSTDITFRSTAVYQPSLVNQHQLIAAQQPSPRPNPIASGHARVPLNPVLTNQQQPAAELHRLQHCDSSTAKFPIPPKQATPQPTSKQNRDVPSEHSAAHQGTTVSSSEHTEQASQSLEATGPVSHRGPLASPGSSDQQATTTTQHEQSSPSITLYHQPWEDSHLPLRKRERSISSASHDSWEDPLLCRPPEKRRRTIPSASHQPWEDPLLCTPPRSHYRTISTSSSSTNTSCQDSSHTPQEPSDDLDADMAGNPSTTIDPAREASTSPASDSNEARRDLGKVPTDPVWVRESLEAYNMFQDQEEAYSKHPALDKKVEKILSRKRQSGVTAEEYQEFKLTLSEYRDSNEDSMVNNVLPFLIKESRKVPPNRAPKAGAIMEPLDEEDELGIDSEDSDFEYSTDDLTEQDQTVLAKMADLAKDEVWVSVSFLRSGVVQISNRDLWRTPLPSRFPDDAGLDKDLLKAMAKEDKLSNPKPDRVYGVSGTKFKWPQGFRTPSVIRLYLNTIRSCYHAYLINEAKAAGGDIREARNQACRGGTALVLSARELRALLGEKDVDGADLRTIVFSMVMSPETVEIWVYWAEVPRKKQHGEATQRPVYHMNLVRSESLNNKTGMEKMRACLHNIIDWGVGSRWDELQPLYAKIIEFGRKHDEEKLQKGNGNKVQKLRRIKGDFMFGVFHSGLSRSRERPGGGGGGGGGLGNELATEAHRCCGNHDWGCFIMEHRIERRVSCDFSPSSPSLPNMANFDICSDPSDSGSIQSWLAVQPDDPNDYESLPAPRRSPSAQKRHARRRRCLGELEPNTVVMSSPGKALRTKSKKGEKDTDPKTPKRGENARGKPSKLPVRPPHTMPSTDGKVFEDDDDQGNEPTPKASQKQLSLQNAPKFDRPKVEESRSQNTESSSNTDPSKGRQRSPSPQRTLSNLTIAEIQVIPVVIGSTVVSLPEDVQNLYADLEDLQSRMGLLPVSIRHTAKHQFQIDRDHYYSSATRPRSEGALIAEDVRTWVDALDIRDAAGECLRKGAPEALWNMNVNSPLLRVALRGSWRDQVWWNDLGSARIYDKDLLPKIPGSNPKSKMVDLGIVIQLHQLGPLYKAVAAKRAQMAYQTINQTDATHLAEEIIAISAE
ncbi:MAG: hypothetical protein Q9184_007212, partial [Pyrenodesmia sp. 2 TL-2023]